MPASLREVICRSSYSFSVILPSRNSSPSYHFFSFCLQELEDTIESLRQQVSVLQSRARVLQEELDTRNQFSSSFNVSPVREQDEL